jgi:hypothetical protein
MDTKKLFHNNHIYQQIKDKSQSTQSSFRQLGI